MNNLYLAFSVVFPLFCMMALGYFLRVIKLFNKAFLTQLNKVCFQVFLPTILFVNIYQSDFSKAFSVKTVGFAVLCIISAFLLLLWIIPKVVKDNQQRGVMIQGIFRSNFILFGIPISISLYGEGNSSVSAILLAFIIPLFNMLSVVALGLFSKQKQSAKAILKDVIKNPLIIASLAAFIVIIFKIPIPALMEKVLVDIARVATPLALMILGGSFYFKNLKRSWKLLAWAVVGKLFLMPIIFLPIAILVGFKGMERAALLAMLAAPTAVSSFTMAESVGADSELAGQIVAVSSVFSILTLFGWICFIL